MNIIIARLLKNIFNPVNWDYDKLNHVQKNIVENQANLDEIREMVRDEYLYLLDDKPE